MRLPGKELLERDPRLELREVVADAEVRARAEAEVAGDLPRIVRAAGQANDSAISYHFGSRQGLLEAILDRHIELEERVRVGALRGLDQASLDTLVEALVTPTADELLTRAAGGSCGSSSS